jgi:hypothetical protein
VILILNFYANNYKNFNTQNKVKIYTISEPKIKHQSTVFNIISFKSTYFITNRTLKVGSKECKR